MRRVPSTCVPLSPALLLIPWMAACGGDGGAASRWTGTIDTLASGAVHVVNPEAGVWREGEAWTVAEELRIGSADEEGPALFGEVAAVEVDPAGRVWVLERQSKELRVFGADGSHLRTVSREGAGPGELRDPIGWAWGPDGNLWVVDPGNARLSVFDTAGAFVTSHRRAVGGYAMPWVGGFGTDGRLYESAISFREGEMKRVLIRYDSALVPRDTAPLPDFKGEQYELRRENSFMAANVPFTPDMVTDLQPDGSMWSGVSDRYRLHRHRLGGDTARIVERPFQPAAVTGAERDSAVKRLEWFTKQGGRLDASRIPSTKPAFAEVFTDDGGNLWVEPVTASPDEDADRLFDVFDPEGRYLGQVRTPFRIVRRPIFRGGALYTVTTDDDGVQYVVRARITRPGGAGE